VSREDHIAAVFPNRHLAELAVGDLSAAGLGSDELGVALRLGEDFVFERDADRRLFRDAGVGTVVGTPIGLVGGLVVSMAVIPGLALGGILAVSLAGAAWGAVFGGILGADVGDVEWTQHENLLFEHLDEGEVLVVVRAHDRAPLCRQIFTRHGGRLLGEESTSQLQ
jgi:outer membrane lipoprotein SlyB